MFQDTKKTSSSDDKSESEETPCAVPVVDDGVVNDEMHVKPEGTTSLEEVKNGDKKNDSDSTSESTSSED